MRKTPLVYACLFVVMLLAGALAPRFQASAEDNSAAGKNATGIIQACEMSGGTIDSSSSTDDRTVNNNGPSSSTFHCTGGGMGGTTCTATNSGIGCTWKPSSSQSMSEGSGQDVTITSDQTILVTELPADTAIPFAPPSAESPMLVDAVVAWNPSVESAEQTGVNMVNGCGMLGGTGQVIHPDGIPASSSFAVHCESGVLAGMWCWLGAGLSTCYFEPGTGSGATRAQTSAALPTEAPQGVEATPTVASTEAPTEIPMPTATVEPTATEEPVIEPTFVDPTIEPTLPQLEPWTPTPVILT